MNKVSAIKWRHHVGSRMYIPHIVESLQRYSGTLCFGGVDRRKNAGMIRGECHIGGKPSNHRHKMLGIEHPSKIVKYIKDRQNDSSGWWVSIGLAPDASPPLSRSSVMVTSS